MLKKRCGEDDLPKFIEQVEKELGSSAFVIWLQAEMGAGKTFFVRQFLRQRGLSESMPVVSPTYTIMNEYKIDQDWYAHLDLYRAEEDFSLDELGVQDRSYHGVFLEWPEAPSESQQIKPTHILKIDYDDDFDFRNYSFEQI